jgi:hypothetical protein
MNNVSINQIPCLVESTLLKPYLSYLPCIVHREFFSIIFNVKKCAPYLIKYSTHACYKNKENRREIKMTQFGGTSTSLVTR